ncbi:hypothetical protein CANINC_003052 [Pichia inconspicua]|uniref:DOCKER domain-containing protein n=1 Tax=Pichia inconspicua TaxID=52247 RepID=A0A4T0WZP7_9ASCO|nr:hypothetical protein CANINC_003052 [[Candida] inconspicua]
MNHQCNWVPTEKLHLAEVIKSFTPLDDDSLSSKVPKNILKNLTNVFPGHQFYVFETLRSGNGFVWCRGYLISPPVPSDFLSASVDIKKLPEAKVSVCIIPKLYLKYLKELDIQMSESNDTLESSLIDDTIDDEFTFSGNGSERITRKLTRPSLPINNIANDLISEIKSALKTLSSTIFAVYAKNQFEFFEKLVKIYYELDDIRLNFEHDLLTAFEKDLAKQKFILLMSKISKLLASGGGAINRSHYSKSDIDGKESILSRDEKTAELFQFNENIDSIVNPAKIAQNQVTSSLSPRFIDPETVKFVPSKNNKFVETLPSNIMVDFKEVIGSSAVVPKGYAGLKAYLYLRNAKKRLTEAFCISIDAGQDLQLDNLAAALFTNIPAEEVDNGKVYLVALLTENIADDKGTLQYIRKGVCAGVADISRIFSHKKGHLVSGQSHRFVIKLFSSFLDAQKQEITLFAGMNQMMAKSLTMVNNGWGELVDRIISGSSKGIAVNPRAERLILGIKELKMNSENKKTLDKISGSSGDYNNIAWACVPTLKFNHLEKNENRIFLKLNKIVKLDIPTKETSFFTVHVRASNKNLKFAKGRNEKPQEEWKFLSVSPEEYVQELISVCGLNDKPDNGKDWLIFDLYHDYNYVGSAQYLLREGDVIHVNGLNSRSSISVDVISTDTKITAAIEIDLDVSSTIYNRDPTAVSILNWRKKFGNDLAANEAEFIDLLSSIRRLKLKDQAEIFSSLSFELICAYEESLKSSLPKLSHAIFIALVHSLDLIIARNNEYVSLFESMTTQCAEFFPKIGEHLLHSMTSIFQNFQSEWSATGRALCRASYLVLKISSLCVYSETEYKKQIIAFSDAITKFLSANSDEIIADQLLILETLELYTDVFSLFFTPQEVVNFAVDWITVNKLKGLGCVEDPNLTALVNRKKTREHKFIITKLLIFNRILNNRSYFVNNVEPSIITLLKTAFDLSLSVLSSDLMDVECSRLALSVYLSICKISFGSDKIFTDDTNYLYMTLIHLLPFLMNTFNAYREYCYKTGLFDKKRTFTALFPNKYSIEENTMDSIVTDVTYVEILVELLVIITYTAKIYEFYEPNFKKNPSLGPYQQILDKFNVPKFDSIATCQTMLLIVEEMVHPSYFPAGSWLSLHSISVYAAFIMLSLFKPYMPVAEMDNVPMWNQYLILLCAITSSKPISIEHLTSTPKKCCYLLTSDISTKAALLIQDTWTELGNVASDEDNARFQLKVFGGYQSSAMMMNKYQLLQHVFLFSMQHNESCLRVGVNIYWAYIAAELSVKDTLFELEKESITALYELFENENVSSPESAQIEAFIKAVEATSKKLDIEDISYNDVKGLITTISNFLSTLSKLKQVPTGEEFDDDRTFYKLHISSYLMNVDRPELFQSFISDLYESYLNRKNYVQAALSLELLANTWDWDINTYLPACDKPKLTSQTAFKRKTDLFKIIAKNFVKGNKLEQAVDIYTEMLDAYSKHNFDLAGLSYCHTELGKLYSELENVDRLESTFFKLTFIGLGFPDTIRGKEFIYEGLSYEHITSVHSRLNRLYPGTRIITNEEESFKLFEEAPIGRYLFIKTVTPRKESHGANMSVMARQYVDNKNLNTFVSTRRLPGASNITNLWTEETTYTTYMTFPTLMNRSEIEKVTTFKIPPIKNAIRSLILKNEELYNLEFMINQNLKDNISLSSIASSAMFNNVSRILAGTVDSPVNGGAGQFKVFFELNNQSIDKGESEEEYEADCVQLKECFNELIRLLNKLLKLHGLIVSDPLKPQHEALIQLFTQNFQEEIAELGLDVTMELDYHSLMKSLTSQNVYSKHRTGHSSSGLAHSASFSQIAQSSSNRSITASTNSKPKHTHNSVNSLTRHMTSNSSKLGTLLAASRNGKSDNSSLTRSTYSDDFSLAPTTRSGKKNLLNYQ